MKTETPIVLVVLVFISIVIAVDTVRQRKIRAERAIDLEGLVASRLAEPGPPVFTEALASALTREPPVRADLYVTLTETLEIANLRPRLRDGC